MKKKLLHVTVAVAVLLVLIAFSGICSFAASQTANDCADALYKLGLFSGTGINADGTPIYNLDKAPTRTEAITMLVKLLGKEVEAKSKTWDMPFDDVDDWAKPYVGYAYNNGLTSGISATKFGSRSKTTETQYITFILRALGYSDNDGDFVWDQSKILSNRLGITEGTANSNFLRADVAEISYFALNTAMKNSDDRLIDLLYANHAVAAKDIPEVYRARKNSDGSKIYLPDGTIDGVSYRDLARACGCDEDICYIVNPKTEADHINNVKYVLLTGQWTYKKMGSDFTPVTSWGNCARTVAGQNKTLSNMQGQLFGVFSNHWNEFYYENGAYSLYCYFDPVMSPKDIQTHLVEAYKIIDAKHNEFFSSGKLTEESTDYEIVKAYTDWMLEFTKSTTDRTEGFPAATLTQTAYGYLGLRHSNCVGRAAAVAMAWNYEGIPAYIVISGMKEAGNYDDHVLPWTVIDGQEYVSEIRGTTGLCKVAEDKSVPELHQFLSPYYVAMARKYMGLSFDPAYDGTDPDLLSKVDRCKACVNGIPCTVEYVKTTDSGDEIYHVKVDPSYSETAKQLYWVTLSTADGRGQRSVSGARDLATMKAGIDVTIAGYRRLESLFYGMDTLCVVIAQ